MTTFDLIIFVLYLAGIVLFGISFYRKGRSSDDYSTGSGTLPAWVIGLSIFATFVSSISYLALPGAAYLSNWNAFVFSLSIPEIGRASCRERVQLFMQSVCKKTHKRK